MEKRGRGRPKSTDAEKKKRKILRLYNSDEPMSLQEIGDSVGVSRAYVSLVLREFGIKPDDERTKDMSETIEQIRKLSGLTDTKIAELLGDIGYELIGRWANGVSPEAKYQRRLTFLLSALEYAQRQAS